MKRARISAAVATIAGAVALVPLLASPAHAATSFYSAPETCINLGDFYECQTYTGHYNSSYQSGSGVYLYTGIVTLNYYGTSVDGPYSGSADIKSTYISKGGPTEVSRQTRSITFTVSGMTCISELTQVYAGGQVRIASTSTDCN